jgi:hypothetical protein
LSRASPYLQEAWVRWANRGALARRDIELVLGGFETKSRVLKGLCEKIREHRRDDFSQLTIAHEEAAKRWDERLVRLREWIASSENLSQTSNGLTAWRETAQWFDRAQVISRQFEEALERKIGSMGMRLIALRDRSSSWLDRLSVKEIELAEMINRQGDSTPGLFVSSGRKRTSLDFVFLEREEEGRISLEFRKMSADIRQALHRLSRPETWVLHKVTPYPAYVEIRKNQVFDQWRPLQRKLDALSEEALHLGLSFEEGRKRLRGIYEIVQKMKVVEPEFPASRPLLHRLFNLRNE